MYSLVRTQTPKAIAFKQVPVLVASLSIAEVFYKFHSFLLECMAFLVTWFVFDALVSTVFGRASRVDN